jgi:hypothetical protein
MDLVMAKMQDFWGNYFQRYGSRSSRRKCLPGSDQSSWGKDTHLAHNFRLSDVVYMGMLGSSASTWGNSPGDALGTPGIFDAGAFGTSWFLGAQMATSHASVANPPCTTVVRCGHRQVHSLLPSKYALVMYRRPF